MAIEDETVDNRYSAIILQLCKNCKMLIKIRLCLAGIKLQKQFWGIRKLSQSFSMGKVGLQKDCNQYYESFSKKKICFSVGEVLGSETSELC